MSEQLKKLELAVVVTLWWMEKILSSAKLTAVELPDIKKVESNNAMLIYTNFIAQLDQTPGMKSYKNFAAMMIEYLQMKSAKDDTVDMNTTSGLSWPLLRFANESAVTIGFRNICMSVNFEKITAVATVSGEQETIYPLVIEKKPEEALV